MNQAIEIHDSVIDSVVTEGAESILHFKQVYIHKSAGRPGWDSGSGLVQEAQLRFSAATIEGKFSELPRDLHGGYIKFAGNLSENIIPIPLDFNDEVELRLEGWGEVIIIRAKQVRLELLGAAEYVEEFAGSDLGTV